MVGSMRTAILGALLALPGMAAAQSFPGAPAPPVADPFSGRLGLVPPARGPGASGPGAPASPLPGTPPLPRAGAATPESGVDPLTGRTDPNLARRPGEYTPAYDPATGQAVLPRVPRGSAAPTDPFSPVPGPSFPGAGPASGSAAIAPPPRPAYGAPAAPLPNPAQGGYPPSGSYGSPGTAPVPGASSFDRFGGGNDRYNYGRPTR